MLKAPIFSTQTRGISLAISGSEDPCSLLSHWCLQCFGGHSAGWRTSWCLQHHATAVTSNIVKIYGSKFPPTVSKHCHHQHSPIPKTIQAIWNTNKPSSYDIQDAASSVKHHGSHCSQQQQILVWYFYRPANIQQSSLNKPILQFIPCGHFLLTCSRPAQYVQISKYNITF